MGTRFAGRNLASLAALTALAFAPVPTLARDHADHADDDFASDLNLVAVLARLPLRHEPLALVDANTGAANRFLVQRDERRASPRVLALDPVVAGVIGDVDGILVPGGFGERGSACKIQAAKFARLKDVPYFGICFGMQMACIEAARNTAGIKAANSTEFDAETPNPVIALITEWKDQDGSIQKRDANSDLGGTMRLGAQSSDVQRGTLAHQIYGDVVTERHRHRYEANVNYLDDLRKAGLVISALTQREQLTEIVELPQTVHPWYVGVQFHPEFKSTPWDGHPLFNAFVKAAIANKAKA